MAGTVIAIISTTLTTVSVMTVLIGLILKSKERQVKLEDKVANLEAQVKAEEISNKEKFKDYYSFKNSTALTLNDISNKQETTNSLLLEIKEDLKELKKHE